MLEELVVFEEALGRQRRQVRVKEMVPLGSSLSAGNCGDRYVNWHGIRRRGHDETLYGQHLALTTEYSVGRSIKDQSANEI